MREKEVNDGSSLGSDAVDVVFNVAHVVSAQDKSVASLSPAGRPRVANNPIVLAVQVSVTNNDDSMVGITTAARTGVNSIAKPYQVRESVITEIFVSD